MNQYLEVFIEESKEHLQSCNEKLLELEKDPQNLIIVNEIFRSAHTLKGMAATMGYEDLANLTHQMENVLDAIRNHKLTVFTGLLDVVFDAVDYLEEMVLHIASGGDGKKDVTSVVQKLLAIEKGEPLISEVTNEVAAAIAPVGEKEGYKSQYDEFDLTVLEQSKEQGFLSYEITIHLRENCLLKSARVFMVFGLLEKIGDIIKSNPPANRLEEEQFDTEFTITYITNVSSSDLEKQIMSVSEIDKVEIKAISMEMIKNNEKKQHEITEKTFENKQVQSGQTEVELTAVNQKQSNQKAQNNSKTIRVNIERLDILMNLFEELVTDRGRLEQISKDLNNQELHETVERMSRISSDLQNIILNMRMVPVETVFNRFPKMVRGLARDLNKKIHLEIIGADTELDRTVIDEIGDPLIHLLRNALDHGIEAPDVRMAKGKNEEGTVVLKAYHSGNHVFIDIEDDGAGINRNRVIQKAISKGIINEQIASTLTDRQVSELIFAPGFSTAEVISDVSGRGVGLDVVKNTIESLGGSVTIDSAEDEGCIFSIQLPLTLSIISVMLVEVQNEKYAIPLSSIIETAIVKKTDILNAHNQRVIDFRGKVIPLVDLSDIFNVPVNKQEDELLSVIVVRKGDKMAGLVVSSFIGQQEIVLKSLGNYLTSVFAISGATILGDGQVALIVDCNALIK